MEPSTLIAGTSLIWQLMKDLFEGAEKRRIASYSAQQIDRTIQHVDQLLELEIEEVHAALEVAKTAEHRDDRIAKAATLSTASPLLRKIATGFPPSFDHLERLADVRIKKRRAEADYVKDLLLLEKKKRINFQPEVAA